MNSLFLDKDADAIYEEFEESLYADDREDEYREDEYREDRMEQLISRYGY